jgi:hypothetical protein
VDEVTLAGFAVILILPLLPRRRSMHWGENERNSGTTWAGGEGYLLRTRDGRALGQDFAKKCSDALGRQNPM